MFIGLSLHWQEGYIDKYLEIYAADDSFLLLAPVALPLADPSLDTKWDDPPCQPALILLALGNRRVS